MRMNAQIVDWLVFLALITSCTYVNTVPFELEGNPLTATEGSCKEIKCTVTTGISDDGAYWFWMKDAQWIQAHSNFTATIIYSTNNLTRPVSSDFAGRVKYIGSSSSSWSTRTWSTYDPKLCSILICNLKTTDSGQYSFRFIGPNNVKWVTENKVTLTVSENPCMITFDKPPVMKENDTMTLTCSTSSRCNSHLQIEDLSKPPLTLTRKKYDKENNDTHKSITVTLKADWQDDGRVFSCQEQDNKDKYLIQNISITVEYAPRDISARKSHENVKEGDSVTLTCFAKGRPDPTLTWFRNNTSMEFKTQSEWKITEITDTENGEYHCVAENKYGTIKSNPVTINVTYAPDVEIKRTSPNSALREGDTMTLNCNVKRSNPQPDTFFWLKDEQVIANKHTYVQTMNPEDSGNYICKATNTVGTGASKPLRINVEYHPRNTKISNSESNENVKAGRSLTFTCNSDANPAPKRYSWYRYDTKQPDSSLWTSRSTDENLLRLESVQRADEACYTCNATNSIGTGYDSNPMCIKVQYSPTVPVLSMATEVTENQTITINCTVESFPPSQLTLTRNSTLSSERHIFQTGGYWNSPNKLQYRFNATSNDAGFYTCNAQNSEGSNKSVVKQLVVKYIPKDVKIQVQPGVDVNETKSLTLYCTAKSYPQANSFSWMKDGKEEFSWKTQISTVKSVSVSHSGLYRCAATNIIGTGQSPEVEVKVSYAPKHTKIIKTEQRDRDGKSFVTLTCSTQCYPPVTQYLWYKNEKGIKTDRQVYEGQNFTVYSDQPGVYYCVAKNLINKKQSDPVHLFDGSLRLLMFILCSILILLVVVVIFLVYRYRKTNSVQHGTTQRCCGFLCWSNGPRRGHLIQETVLAEPFRSRDDLLPERSYGPEARRCQRPPDSTPVSDISTVYSTVNPTHRKQAPTAQNPTRLQGGHTMDDSLNYTSIHFEDKQKNKQPKPAEDTVYAKVCRPNSQKKIEQDRLADYENIGTTLAAKSPNPLDDDTDTSDDDDDVQLNYTQVNFTAKPGHQRDDTDSSTSDDYEVHYSDVKL